MTKAFDRVPHGRLLLKIKYCRLADPMCFWLAFYYSDPSLISSISETLAYPRQSLAV